MLINQIFNNTNNIQLLLTAIKMQAIEDYEKIWIMQDFIQVPPLLK